MIPAYFFNVIREMIPLNIRSNYITGARADAKALTGHEYALFSPENWIC